MSLNQEYPVIDGIVPSYADIKCSITPQGAPLIEMVDIKNISSGSTLEVGEQVGATGGRVKARTTGKSKHEASMTLYFTGFNKLIDGLAQAALAAGHTRGNQVVIGVVQFGITLIWTPPGSSDIFERRLKGCRYMGDKLDASEGTDAQGVDVALNPLENVYMRNGKEIVIL
jgi:hypothetical protein